MVLVTKFDGRKQEFQKRKVIRTCLRMHASPEVAEKIADKIEKEIYEGIPTKKILKLIFKYLREYRPEIRHQKDLREAICLLRPKPDFEEFVNLLLKAYGYEVQPPQIVKGKCIEHEIDGIAKKDGKTFYVEVKHHFNPHTYTGIDVCLEANSILEDFKEGFENGITPIKFDKVLIVCNTKFSEHAKRYAECKNIQLLGWKNPEERGLERLIEEKKLYPITFLKALSFEDEKKFGDAGIVLLKQLTELELEKIHLKTRISRKKLRVYIKKATEILGS